MKHTRVHEQRFFPWIHADSALKLAIAGVSLDDHRFEHIDARTHLLELSGTWQRAQLELEVMATKAVVRRVVAEHERAAPPVTVLLVLRCDRTHLRRRLAAWDWGAGQADGFKCTITLERDELADRFELCAFLIRARAAQGPSSGVASRIGAELASARPWIVQVDEPPTRSGNFLDVQYRSFAEDPGVPGSRKPALYRLDCEREDPILYLNADHQDIRPVLDNKGTHGRRARARELLFERIEVGVWTQLVLRASARLAEDGELAYAWEHTILEQWLPHLYPESADQRARWERLVADYQQLPKLLANLDITLQIADELPRIAGKLVEEL